MKRKVSFKGNDYFVSPGDRGKGLPQFEQILSPWLYFALHIGQTPS